MTLPQDLTSLVRDRLREPDGLPPPRIEELGPLVHQTPQDRGRLPRFDRGRFQTMFSATKLLIAGAIVAMFGGFLLSGFLMPPTEESLQPAAASATSSEGPDVPDASTRSDLLPGVDLVTEEVEPGVYRVLSDGVRELTRTGRSAFDMQRIHAAEDGDIWTLWGHIDESFPDRIESAVYRIGHPGDLEGLDLSHLDDLEPWLEPASETVAEGSLGDDGSARWTVTGDFWEGGYEALVRTDATGSSRYAAEDDLPIDAYRIHRFEQFLPTSPDGSVWLRLNGQGHACGGIGRFDGTTLTRFLADACVYSWDVDPAGSVWLIAGHDGGLGAQHEGLIAGPFDTYVITPQAVLAAE